MSWLEDFTDGEAVWKQLLASPSIESFFERAEALTAWERKKERKKVFLYHAIRDKQEAAESLAQSTRRVDAALR